MKNLIEQLQGKYVYANSDEEGAEIVMLLAKAGGDNCRFLKGCKQIQYFLDGEGIIRASLSGHSNFTLSELRDLVSSKEVQYFNPPVEMEVSDNGEQWEKADVRFIEPDGTTWEGDSENLSSWKHSRPIPVETLTISEAEKQLSEFKNCNVKIK